MLDLAARLSVGQTTPDGHQLSSGSTLVLTAEDGLADTVRPRLDAAGADCTRVLTLVDVIDANQPIPPYFPGHIPALDRAIREAGPQLVIIDPLMAYLDGAVNSWRDQDVRRALRPLAGLADETGAAVVMIRHLTKRPGGQAIYRGGGSIGIGGQARSVLVVARDPAEDGSVVLASTKENLGPRAPSLRYRLEAHGQHGVVRVVWLGESTHTADQLMAAPVDPGERSAAERAREVLLEALDGGARPQRDVVREVARAADVSEATVR